MTSNNTEAAKCQCKCACDCRRMTKEEKQAEKRYDVIRETRDFEIRLLWQRSLFFWGFIASAFAGYAYLGDATKPNEFAQVLVTAFGFICSWCWYLINLGGKYWQENWERKLNHQEKAVTGKMFSNPKRGQYPRYSPSKITIDLSHFTALIWLFLLVDFAVDILPADSMKLDKEFLIVFKINSMPFIVLLITLAAAYAICRRALSHDSASKR